MGINGGGIVVNNPQQTVAFIGTGLIFSVRDGANSGQLNSAGFTIQQSGGLGPGPAPSAFVTSQRVFELPGEVASMVKQPFAKA